MTGTDSTVGSADLRSQFFDKSVKQIAKRMYKFKQSLTIVSTSAWKNYFYREDPTVLAGRGVQTVKGIPRGADFPQASVEWKRIQAVINKYGLEDFVYWEDILSDDVDVRDRTLYKIAEGVTKAVDDQILIDLGGNLAQGATDSTGTQTFNINGYEWNETSAAILDNLFRAKQLIAENNYDTSNLECWVSPRDMRSIMKWLSDKGTQFPQMANTIAENGRTLKLAGIQFVESNSMTSSNALVIVPKICATWKELVPLQTTTIEDQFKGIKIRSVEMGVTNLTDPLAVVRITGTQSGRV